jgi:hypothetical protein
MIVMWRNSSKSGWRKFRQKFPDTCPSGDTIPKLVKEVRTHGILSDSRQKEIMF